MSRKFIVTVKAKHDCQPLLRQTGDGLWYLNSFMIATHDGRQCKGSIALNILLLPASFALA